MQLSMNILQTDMETTQIEIGEPSYLAAARRAPSAHNAQPWRLYRQADGSYLLGYAYADRLSDRKSTRLNSSHQIISYAVFCLKKKKKPPTTQLHTHARARPPATNLHC